MTPPTQEDCISLPVDATDSASVICARAEKTANSRGKKVRFMIAGIPMECSPGAEADELFSIWWSRFKNKDLEARSAFVHQSEV